MCLSVKGKVTEPLHSREKPTHSDAHYAHLQYTVCLDGESFIFMENNLLKPVLYLSLFRYQHYDSKFFSHDRK